MTQNDRASAVREMWTLSPWHCTDLPIEHRWKLSHNLFPVGMQGSSTLPVDGIIGTDMILSFVSGDGFQPVLAILVCMVTFREDTKPLHCDLIAPATDS